MFETNLIDFKLFQTFALIFLKQSLQVNIDQFLISTNAKTLIH